jgi:hypothetical protein
MIAEIDPRLSYAIGDEVSQDVPIQSDDIVAEFIPEDGRGQANSREPSCIRMSIDWNGRDGRIG